MLSHVQDAGAVEAPGRPAEQLRTVPVNATEAGLPIDSFVKKIKKHNFFIGFFLIFHLIAVAKA